MSAFESLGIRSTRLPPRANPGHEYVMRLHSLRRVLALRRRTIDDVVNDPIAKNEIFGYWKLHKQILRSGEITDLERQWNSRGRRA